VATIAPACCVTRVAYHDFHDGQAGSLSYGLPAPVAAAVIVEVTRHVMKVVVVPIVAARVIMIVTAIATEVTMAIMAVTIMTKMHAAMMHMTVMGRGRTGTEQSHAANHYRQKQTAQSIHELIPVEVGQGRGSRSSRVPPLPE
jgi:hypothetical protein